jgi:AcrR family transcriptional regulator
MPSAELVATNGGAARRPGTPEDPRERRARVADFQRSRLLRAALAVAHEHGYERMTVALVISQARISRRTFYELFDNRDDCYLALYDEALSDIAAAVRPPYDGEGTWSERLRRGLAALLAFLESEHELAALVVSHLRGAGPRCTKRRARTLALLTEAVDAGRSQAKPGHEPPPLTAEVVVGGVLAVLDSRLRLRHAHVTGMLNPLMAMIVLPYLGAAAAARELGRPSSPSRPARRPQSNGPPTHPAMRVTYRTARTLAAIAAAPGASNAEVAALAGIGDEGQASRLLARLARLGLIENAAGMRRGGANAWRLTPYGAACEREISRASGAAANRPVAPRRGSAC